MNIKINRKRWCLKPFSSVRYLGFEETTGEFIECMNASNIGDLPELFLYIDGYLNFYLNC